MTPPLEPASIPPEDGDPVAGAKHAARVRAQKARACLDIAVCREHSHALAELLLALPELADVRVVLAYAALPAELDPQLAAWELRKRGVAICYPRIEAPGVLGLHQVEHPSDLMPAALGIREPAKDSPRTAHDTVDAVLVPGVAFDASGARLGYGGGYFDRLLPLLRPDCVRIGIAFDEQILPDIPAEEHDEYVDFVVTPTRVIRDEARRR